MRALLFLFLSLIVISCSYKKGEFVADPSKILRRINIIGVIHLPERNKAKLRLLNASWNKSGSKKFNNETIRKMLEKFVGEINISIWEDGRFHARLITLSAGIQELFPIFEDLILNPVFDDGVVELEKKIACEELIRIKEKSFALAVSVASHFVHASEWLDCDKIDQINVEEIQKFKDAIKFQHVKYITNIQDEKIIHGLQKFLSQLPRGIKTMDKSREYLVNPPVAIWIKGPFDQATTLLVSRSENIKTKERYYLRLFSLVTSSDFDSRVFTRIRAEEGLAYLAEAGWSADYEKGLAYFVVQHSKENLSKILEKIFEILHELRNQDVPTVELKKVYHREIQKLHFSKEDPMSRIVQESFLKFFGLPSDDDEKFVSFLNSVKPAHFRQVLNKLLLPNITEKFFLIVVNKDSPFDQIRSKFPNIKFLEVDLDDKFKLLY